MTKILIGAGDLRDLIAKHPHIEVALLKSVVPQIAEMIRKQAISREPAIKQMVDETFRQVMLAVGSRHGITDAMKGVIRIYLAEVWNEQAKEIANETARAAATEIVRDAIASELKVVREQIVLDDKKARGQIDAYAKEAAEREVLALLRAGNLTIKA